MTVVDGTPQVAADRWSYESHPLERGAALTLVGLVAGYAILGLIVLTPEAVYSGDIGVKFVEARALAANRFSSLDIPYPGARLDPARECFPIRPPFVFTSAGGTQAIFSPASAVIQAAAAGLAGLNGLIALSVAAGAVILLGAARMAQGSRIPILLALGAGGPLWFYSVSGWEHAPAVALSTAAFAVAATARIQRAPLLAGLLIGAAAIVRDEALLLVPGLLLVLWLRTRATRPILMAVTAALVPLTAAAILEVSWFGRPPAAHLRHAVHIVQKAAHLTSAPNPELPVREAFTFRQRYETVVQYWLLGYGSDRTILLFALALIVALGIRWKYRTSVALLVWLICAIGLAAMDLWDVATAPKWLAGLQRVSPFLVFAFLPAPPGSERRDPLALPVAVAAVVYLIVAFVGVDTSGGKSLGPRLLLPLFPLLTVTAVTRIVDYNRARTAADRWIGRGGVALVVMAILIHVSGTIPAYVARNREDGSAVKAVSAASESIVLADEEFTAQLLLPLYYSKIVLLVDTPEVGRKLAQRLADERVTKLIMISRRSTAQISLLPFDLERIEPAGRLSIQYWQR